MTRPTPTLAETIAALPDLGEVQGFTDQLREDGRLDEDARQLLATRMAQIQRATIKR